MQWASESRSAAHPDTRMSDELLYPLRDIRLGKVENLQHALRQSGVFQERCEELVHLRDEQGCCAFL